MVCTKKAWPLFAKLMSACDVKRFLRRMWGFHLSHLGLNYMRICSIHDHSTETSSLFHPSFPLIHSEPPPPFCCLRGGKWNEVRLTKQSKNTTLTKTGLKKDCRVLTCRNVVQYITRDTRQILEREKKRDASTNLTWKSSWTCCICHVSKVHPQKKKKKAYKELISCVREAIIELVKVLASQ